MDCNAGGNETVSPGDYEDDDQLITDFITSAEQLCRDDPPGRWEADLRRSED